MALRNHPGGMLGVSQELATSVYRDYLQEVRDTDNFRSERKAEFIQTVMGERIRQGILPREAVQEAAEAFDLMEKLAQEDANATRGEA